MKTVLHPEKNTFLKVTLSSQKTVNTPPLYSRQKINFPISVVNFVFMKRTERKLPVLTKSTVKQTTSKNQAVTWEEDGLSTITTYTQRFDLNLFFISGRRVFPLSAFGVETQILASLTC